MNRSSLDRQGKRNAALGLRKNHQQRGRRSLVGCEKTTGEKDEVGKFLSKCSKEDDREEAAAVSKGKTTDAATLCNRHPAWEERVFPEPRPQAERGCCGSLLLHLFGSLSSSSWG